MALSKELYQRFLKGDCTAEEEAQVVHYFQQHPEEADAYLHWQDWEGFEPEVKLHTAVADKVWRRIYHAVTLRKNLLRTGYRMMAAAMIAGAMALCWWMVVQQSKTPVAKPALATVATPDTPWVQHRNTTRSIARLLLDDSSVVLLHPGSQIRYRAYFERHKRDLWLSGTASFAVARNDRYPFTVYSGNVATTALGTRFLVKEHAVNKRVTVVLYSGKVVVRMQSTLPLCYLLPGDKLVYDVHTAKPLVYRSAAGKQRTAPGNESTVDRADAWVFSKQPLPQVLETLQQHFSTPVTYNKRALSGIRITAEFSKEDSLEQILQLIAMLNHLTVVRDGTGYTLRKQ